MSLKELVHLTLQYMQQEYTLPQKKPLPVPVPDSFQTLAKTFPHLKFFSHPPPDTQAKEIKERWKIRLKGADIILLSFEETKEERLLLENIARAIQKYNRSAAVLKAEEVTVASAKWIIAEEKALLAHPFSLPTIKLLPLASYLQSQELKKELWHTLKSELKL